MQVICTPLHLLALNYFNVREATLGERLARRVTPNSSSTHVNL